MELDEHQKNPYESLFILDGKEEEFKPGNMYMKKKLILSDIVKYVQYTPHWSLQIRS